MATLDEVVQNRDVFQVIINLIFPKNLNGSTKANKTTRKDLRTLSRAWNSAILESDPALELRLHRLFPKKLIKEEEKLPKFLDPNLARSVLLDMGRQGMHNDFETGQRFLTFMHKFGDSLVVLELKVFPSFIPTLHQAFVHNELPNIRKVNLFIGKRGYGEGVELDPVTPTDDIPAKEFLFELKVDLASWRRTKLPWDEEQLKKLYIFLEKLLIASKDSMAALSWTGPFAPELDFKKLCPKATMALKIIEVDTVDELEESMKRLTLSLRIVGTYRPRRPGQPRRHHCCRNRWSNLRRSWIDDDDDDGWPDF